MTENAGTEYELDFWRRGSLVAGVDEVGRGPLAGPVVAAAVIFAPDSYPEGIRDSKLVNADKRRALLSSITSAAIGLSVAFKDEQYIDEHNILQASVHAMHEAIGALQPQPEHLLIDGNYFYHDEMAFTTIVKGDRKCLSIAAASIVAKVRRDSWMIEVADPRYPHYGFARNKGYGTREHREAILEYGPCPLHRTTFLQKILANGRTVS